MPSETDYDYIVVGSGAGGGPLAANLANGGYKVLLLEAGSDQGDRPTYQVPVFHGFATEDKAMEWDYFVRHYASDAQQTLDSKYDKDRKAIWYPRAGTLGGCTAHNAMITIYGHNKDWDDIAQLTGDPSWRSGNMREHFKNLERCEYVNPPASRNTSGHGFSGWLTTSAADPRLAAGDSQLLTVVASAAIQALLSRIINPSDLALRLFSRLQVDASIVTLRKLIGLILKDPFDPGAAASAIVDNTKNLLTGLFDPNEAQFVDDNLEGPVIVPLAVKGGKEDPKHKGWRNSAREYVLATKDNCPAPGKLDILYNVLVTRVLFRDGAADLTATGVAYVANPHLYAADPSANLARPSLEEFRKQEERVFAGKEVILSAGAFNTPQLLMLSGIGPKDQIEQFKGPDGKPLISCRCDLAGVGSNLQDRYEVGVISELKQDFPLLGGVSFNAPDPGPAFEQAKKTDPALKQWADTGTGLYATNGAVLGIMLKSNPKSADPPDLFVFALPGYFKGYFQTYSEEFEAKRNRLTWAVLKAHTKNNTGTVRLNSADPRDTPAINFNYFPNADKPGGDDDLNAVVQGVKFVRDIMGHPLLAGLVTRTQLLPDKNMQNDAEIAQYVKNEAWGHHASCTCPIGPKDQGGVLDSNFRVHGVKNLRVVDASVFPRIPGFFIVTPIYMISEKASKVILGDAKKTT